MATSDPAMAPTSTSMCPASASSTSEFDATAAPTSNAMKATSSTSAVVRARRSVSADGCPGPCWSWVWPSAMGRHVVRMGEHFLDEPADVGVVEDVEDPGPLPPAAHQAGQAELGQVLGDGGRLGADQLRPLVDRVLALQEGADDPQAGLVGQQLQHPDGGAELLPGGAGRRPGSNYLRRHADIV